MIMVETFWLVVDHVLVGYNIITVMKLMKVWLWESHLSHSSVRNVLSISSRCYWHQTPPVCCGLGDKDVNNNDVDDNGDDDNDVVNKDDNNSADDNSVSHQSESKKLQLEAEPFSAK